MILLPTVRGGRKTENVTSFVEYDRFAGIGLANPVKDGEISSIDLCEIGKLHISLLLAEK
jgi:hypothetical protein